MPDLNEFEELTDLTFDHDNAHLAICHRSQGFSANLRPAALILKAQQELTEETKASLEKMIGKQGIEKASYRNLQRMLESAIKDKVVSLSNKDTWIWLKDFDETTAVFEYQDTLYGINYSLTDNNTIELVGEVQEVVQQDVYVTEDNKSLVLKYKDSSDSSGEIIKKGVNPDKGNKDMSVEQVAELEKQVAELQKANDEAISQAVEKALASQAEVIAKAALEAETVELVKTFEAVTEQEELVKSLVDLGDDSVSVIKALNEMQEALTKAKEETASAVASAEEIKKEFGSKDEGVEVAEGELTKTNSTSMKDAVKAALAKKSQA